MFRTFLAFFSLALPLTTQAASLQIGGEKAELAAVTAPKKEVALEIRIKGKLVQSFPGLGDSLANISFNGHEKPLLILDFDKDGYDEFIVRTTMAPTIGALWVFRYDKAKKLYAHVLNDHGDRYIPVPLTDAVSITPGGDIVFVTPDSHQKVSYRWIGEKYQKLP